jgi:hypothetical protein
VVVQSTRTAQGYLETTESKHIPGISTCVASSALEDVDVQHVSGGCRRLRLGTSWLGKMKGRTLRKQPDRI